MKLLLPLIGILTACSTNPTQRAPTHYRPVYEIQGHSDGSTVSYWCERNGEKLKDCATLEECADCIGEKYENL
jgi:hypothetical protein